MKKEKNAMTLKYKTVFSHSLPYWMSWGHHHGLDEALACSSLQRNLKEALNQEDIERHL